MLLVMHAEIGKHLEQLGPRWDVEKYISAKLNGPVVNLLGLPDAAAVAFLFGFFRRDYGAAGLYDLQKAGALSGVQLAVAAITLTLFLPCIAQFLILKKERGWKLALLTSAGILLIAFVVGFAANALLGGLGVQL